MNIAAGEFPPQVTIAPRCPACESGDTAICRSQGIEINHEGKRCRAQRQYRKCRECGANFGVVHVKGEIEKRRRRGS